MRVDGRWLGIGLAASLLLNLFLAGLAAGRWFAPAPRPAGAGGLAPAARVRLLPADERTRFQQAMAPHRAEVRAARQATRAARARVEADLAAPTYDRARVETDLATLRQAALAQQAAAHVALAEALSTLSPASRATLVAHARAQSGAPRVGEALPAR